VCAGECGFLEEEKGSEGAVPGVLWTEGCFGETRIWRRASESDGKEPGYQESSREYPETTISTYLYPQKYVPKPRQDHLFFFFWGTRTGMLKFPRNIFLTINYVFCP
jgi:hypothetical protein